MSFAIWLLPPPWVFAVVGSVLAVGAAFVSGVLIVRSERREKELERQLSDLKIGDVHQKANHAVVLYNFASLSLALGEFARAHSIARKSDLYAAGYSDTQVQEDRGMDFCLQLSRLLRTQAVRQAVDAIGTRTDASGKSSDPEEVRRLVEADVLTVITKWDKQLSDDLEYYNYLQEKHNHLAKKLDNTRRRTAIYRWAGVTVQILGLLIVMGKDIPRR